MVMEKCEMKKVRNIAVIVLSVIFVQQEFDVRNAELIAKELGVQVVSINPLSYHWKEEMLKVARALSNPDKNSGV